MITALGRLGKEATKAVDLLNSKAHNEDVSDARARVASALALFRIEGEKKTTLPIIRKVLLGPEEQPTLYFTPNKSNSPRVHAVRALEVLAKSGNKQAKQLLIETAKGDENRHVRLAALKALKQE